MQQVHGRVLRSHLCCYSCLQEAGQQCRLESSGLGGSRCRHAALLLTHCHLDATTAHAYMQLASLPRGRGGGKGVRPVGGGRGGEGTEGGRGQKEGGDKRRGEEGENRRQEAGRLPFVLFVSPSQPPQVDQIPLPRPTPPSR